MFYAPSGNNEYIEIHNLSNTATIDLAGYAIQYETNAFDFIRTTGKGTKLLPRAYAIILEGDYDSLNGMYNAAIPAAALVLKINSNAFGSNGMANTAERIVSLIRPDSSVIESYAYTPQNNAAGISDEKIVLNKNNAAVNWANSKTVNGSPGKRNTVTPPDFDLVLSNLTASPGFCKPGTQIQLSSCIKNNGAIQTGSYILKLYHDRNRDNIPGANELIFQLGSFPLAFGDSTILHFNYTLSDTGKQYFIAFVETPSDDVPANNYAYTTVLCTYGTLPVSGLRINEIMYAPANAEPEWIELLNSSAASIDLHKMTIHDKFSLSSINAHRVLKPNEYIVIAKDSSVKNFYSETFSFLTSSLPVFNNDSDAVVLRDSTGRTLDSLFYHAHWGGNNGFSLERVLPDTLSSDSTNWKSCAIVTRATPGQKNSVAIKDYDISVSGITGLPAYVAVGTGFTVNGIIKNNGTMPSGTIVVRLLLDANNDGIPQPNETIALQDIPSLAPHEETTHSFSILPTIPGRLKYFFHASVSQDENIYNDYVVFTVPVVVITVHRNDIIINEIMPRPETGHTEWIELYNNSESSVPLNKFQIADANDSVSFSVTDAILMPGKFIVIGRDNSFSQQYPGVPVLIVQFPTLNDNGDKLMIMDSLGRIIDSLAYSASWIGAHGYSLERIEPSSSSTDSTNWKVCVAPAKSSVGAKNSVTRKDYDIAILGVVQFPKYLEPGSSTTFSAIVSNAGKQACSNIGVKLFHDANNDGIAQSIELISNETLLNLNSGANASVPFIIQPAAVGTYRYILQVVTPLDEAAYNDFYFCSLIVINAAIPRGSIVINEFMCKPETGEGEWIELFNRTDSLIYLRGVQCADSHDTVYLSSTQIPISAHSYLVLTKDSVLIKQFPGINAVICSFPVLNDDGDGIMIIDSLNRMIDSLEYTNSWNIKKGISFERISPSGSSTDTLNWHHCLSPDKATPGRANYVTTKKQDAAITGIYVFPPFAHVGDSIEIYCLIKNLGTSPTVACSLTFFDVTRNKQLFLKNIATTILPGDSLSVSTGYFVLSDTLLNIKVLLTTAAEDDSSNNTKYITYRANEKPGSVIISEVMYAPENGSIEWVELYNNSGTVIDLYDWSISDVQPAPKSGSFSSHVFIDSASYLTVTNAPEASSGVQTRVPFGILNNTGDGVMLYNRGGQVIDSMVYDNSWFGKEGKSLERLRASGSSTDKYNWHYSLSSYGSTPAGKNSSEQLKSNSNPQLLISEILYEPATG
ncbi:MAG: lamin tail domain-containing protein, partial [Ignavibacteriales bacterium]|nr:lamin tail domain-containing protein [Ignavibacteriales bacterium]